MDMLTILWLSIVQGLTEFLPISSSAHLILLSEFLTNKDQGILLDVSMHLGTMFAAIFYFRNEALQLLMGFAPKRKNHINRQKLINIIVATLPILFSGYILRNYIDENLRATEVIAYTTIFFGFLLYFADKTKTRSTNLAAINFRQALIIGICQCLALIPGTSRSGITISAALFLGIGREAASKFSFLLAIPTIGAIAIYEIFILDFEELTGLSMELFFACLASFITAYLTIDIFLRIINKLGFTPFVIYRVILGILLLIFWV
ncbi:MAG: undecaprenyl-diphosphate phosphatase [SAR86 cluster bacterium]|jgi:undecaprenyl-diphosphatase|nr:undecaprenyl-diphosphate phosphatase [SAR86 cluster bacterium]